MKRKKRMVVRTAIFVLLTAFVCSPSVKVNDTDRKFSERSFGFVESIVNLFR